MEADEDQVENVGKIARAKKAVVLERSRAESGRPLLLLRKEGPESR